MPEVVTITPADPRTVAFRAVVAAIKAHAPLVDKVAAWIIHDGTPDAAQTLEVHQNAVRLTPVYERETAHSVKAGVRTWEGPVLVKVWTRVASANVDNVLNLAGLIEDAVMSISQADLRTAGISWLELVSPAAQAVEHGTSEGAFRFVVHIER